MAQQNKMEALLAELLEATTKNLLTKIQAGIASPADIKNARELLKDNGITSDASEEGCELDVLSKALPFPSKVALVQR